MRSAKEIREYIAELESDDEDYSLDEEQQAEVAILKWALEDSEPDISLKDVFMRHTLDWDCHKFQKIATQCGYKYLCWNGKIYDTSEFYHSFERADTGLTIQDLT